MFQFLSSWSVSESNSERQLDEEFGKAESDWMGMRGRKWDANQILSRLSFSPLNVFS